MKFKKWKEPDAIELALVGILVIWAFAAMYLLMQAATLSQPNILSWTSLTAFFTGFLSIVVLVIAVILADIRKEIVK